MTAEELTSTEAKELQIEATSPLDLRTLFTAGVHFGHPTKRWNPKMEEYIFSKRAGAHIIDLSKTISCLEKAKEFVEENVGNGGECLFVGTKGQAQKAIEKYANESDSMYINQRWLGGMMTNFQTVKKRIERLIYLEDSHAKGDVDVQTKREALKASNEIERLNKFFGGIKEMDKLPNLIYVVDTVSERIAISEANRLNIPVVAIVDTNSDPTGIDYPIPGNDDSIRSIEIITSQIASAISRGKVSAKTKVEEKLATEADLEAQEQAAREAIQLEAAKRSEQQLEKTNTKTDPKKNSSDSKKSTLKDSKSSDSSDQSSIDSVKENKTTIKTKSSNTKKSENSDNKTEDKKSKITKKDSGEKKE